MLCALVRNDKGFFNSLVQDILVSSLSYISYLVSYISYLVSAISYCIMENLPNGFTLSIPDGCFPLSTDSMVLSHFVKLVPGARVLDLGSGCGTLGLLLCSRDETCQICGMEIDPAAHQAAAENIRRNGLCTRMESICAPLQSVSERFSPGSFSVCVSNPPYFSGGARSRRTPLARQTDLCPPQALFDAAAWALKYGGELFLVHRPEMLAHLIACGARVALEAKELCLVRHREGGKVNLILLRFRKGGKPGISLSEWSLHHADGRETDRYRQIYHTNSFQ